MLTAGSFDGSHTYADNGVYTVTVTVSDDDGGVDHDHVPGHGQQRRPHAGRRPGTRRLAEDAPLSITDIGKFTDPGFDNLLNVGGETTERFTFAIDWGDGNRRRFRSRTDQHAGAAGRAHRRVVRRRSTSIPNGGIYTVTVTLSDDDGGTASGTFLVYVGPTLTVPAQPARSTKVRR